MEHAHYCDRCGVIVIVHCHGHVDPSTQTCEYATDDPDWNWCAPCYEFRQEQVETEWEAVYESR